MDERADEQVTPERSPEANGPQGIPRGYAVEFGTGRLVPITYAQSARKSAYVQASKRKKRGCCGGR